MTETEIALEAAINVLRDSVESQRMPSGLPLQPDAVEIHARAADHLERLLRETGGKATAMNELADCKRFGVVIETARLRMRPLRDEDLVDLIKLIGNWEVARWTASVPHPYTEADGRKWIALVRQDHANGLPRSFAVALKETDRLIGGVGLDGSAGDESEEHALGYWVGQPYWDNQYGREAVAAIIDYGFRTLGIETIRAHTDPSNVPSQKVLLHCGLKNVGEIELTKPTRHGAWRAPLFRITREDLYHERARPFHWQHASEAD
jgi:RimJ/RimL family protein N-acetyltransferase